MKNLKTIILFLSIIYTIKNNAQIKLNKDYYLSIEPTYRSYGRADQTGYGIGFEYSKNIKEWLGVGLNISYWNNSKKSWDFINPFTSERFIYHNKIKELRIHPFVQLIPLHTKFIDFYAQLGFSTGYFNHILWGGGYATFYNPPEFINFISDKGSNGAYFGYDLGLAIRFKYRNFLIIPNLIKSYNFQDQDGFDSLNLKIGYRF